MSLKNKTLFILSPAFPSNESDEQSPWVPTKQIFIQAINRNYPELEVIIFSFHFPIKKETYWWHGNKVISFGGGKKGTKRKNLFLWLKIFHKLSLEHKNRNLIGIISFWCSDCCLVATYFSRLFGYQHLCWISGQDAKKENKLVRFIRPKPNELVAMSQFLQAEFNKNHKILPKYFIPNGIDTLMFSLEKMDKSIDILGAGSLIPLKQYHVFIDVVAAIRIKYQQINAILCGDGPEEQHLKQQITTLQLQNNVQLIGLQSHRKVLALMEKTKIFLHTANYEGFGVVCIEALYAGAHVISFVRPVNENIQHWHIVSTQQEMIEKAIELLADVATDYTSVLPYDMNDSVKNFIGLFDQNL